MEETLNYLKELINPIIDSVTQSSLYMEWVTNNENFHWHFLAVTFAYLVILAIGHKAKAIDFFYSYLDVFFLLGVPTLLFIMGMIFVPSNDVEKLELFRTIRNIIIAISWFFSWIITYRSNSNRFFVSLFVYIGKLLMVMWACIIVALSLGLAIYLSGQKRKKGEWAKTRKKRNMQNAVGSVAGGVGIITAISLFLCRKNDFSFPPKFRKAELQTETTPETTQEDI